MTVQELREKRNRVWNETKEFLDTHRNEKGTLSAEDDATYSKMEKEITDLGREIARLERQDALEKELSKALCQPLVSKPMTLKEDTKRGRASDVYRKAFWDQVRAKDGISQEVRNALSEGADTEGGYLVPDEFEHTLIQALEEENIVRSHAHVFTTASGSHKIPVVTAKGTASWVDEGQAITESGDTFGQQLIGAHKLATLIKVSEELLNDSAFDLEQYFTTEFSRRIGNAEEDAFLNGNGEGKPTGIFDDTAGAKTGVTTASSAAVTADEIIDLFYSLEGAYRRNAIWIVNDSTIKAIRKLKDGSGQYLWQPALHEGSFDTLLGKRVYTSPFVPEISAGKKTAAFGDISFYWIGDRQGISFRRLNERYAETGQVGFLASKRLDGKLILPDAVKVLQMKS